MRRRVLGVAMLGAATGAPTGRITCIDAQQSKPL